MAPNDGNDLQDLKQKLQLKRRQKKEEEAQIAPEPEAGGATPDEKPASDFDMPFGAALSEDEAKAVMAEASLWDKGGEKVSHGGKTVILGVVFAVAVVVALGVGLIFGKVFKSRELENIRLDEAKAMKEYFVGKKVADGSTTVMQAIDDFKDETTRFVATMEKTRQDGKTPAQMKDQIAGFLKLCLAYAENQTYFPPNQVYGSNVFNAEALSLSLPVVLAAQDVYAEAAVLASMFEKIQALEAPKSAVNATVLVEQEPQTFTPDPPVGEDGQPIPDAPAPTPVEVMRAKLTLVEAGPIAENPLWAESSAADRKRMDQWLVPYSILGVEGVQAAKPGDVGTLDASFIIQKKDDAYVNSMIGEAVGRIVALKATAARYSATKLKALFDRIETQEKYFTL